MEKLTFAPLATPAAQATALSRSNLPAVRPAILDREVDIRFARTLWSSWRPADGNRALVRALTPSEMQALQRRASELQAGLAPLSEADRDHARAALHAMLGGFRSRRETGVDAESAVEVLLAILQEFPAWAVEEGCMRIVKNQVEPPLDRRWAPTDSQVYEIVEGIVRHYRACLKSAQALLTAPVEKPALEEKRFTRAEIEAQLKRTISEKVSREAFDEGGHHQRVAEDLAKSKAEREAKSSSAA